ncbi:uncharacterized protein LACBIDRAFT_305132 [Laccaria bicolor S238N-H82]|uniref:Predicted protein n=1 Tax=Laccaria bicolor (strain S238N-H82 / ATCC MYA-4686) TaxID=486041 RepID=B0CTH3_LACBS|nr:uncharacterized protein LACBIDRAFT_305132 [Laccaria bicolor S238N-H82]EDR13924.1 predicted protein [Laccaria bicolor S238N-H82]|eukprot:XP_001874483.1 predicted protein [Laccaria bicolor S238N-H82]
MADQSSPAPTSNTTSAPSFRDHLTQEDLEEPPAYSPRPDAYTGETTVEYGPSRPFQPAPTQPRQSNSNWLAAPTSPPPQSGQRSPGSLMSLINQITGELTTQLTMARNSAVAARNEALAGSQRTGSNGQWNSYPGQSQRGHLASPPPQHPAYSLQHSSSSSLHPPPNLPPRSNLLPPPPRHPSSSVTNFTRPVSDSMTPPLPPRRRHSSEFARDFYAAGPLEAVSNPDVGSASGSESGVRHTRSVSESGGSSSASRNGAATDWGGDDGRPTTTPTPGHPLLHNGKLLVYPKGYECNKCHNTGYKSNDPLNPCKKCWGKHAKPFTGPLVYASFSGPDATGNFQRPLPAQSHSSHSRNTLTKNSRPPSGTGASSQASSSSGYNPTYISPPPPPVPYPPNVNVPHPSTPNPNVPYPPNISYPSRNGPPPGAVVYTSGDPRLGGRLCWRCDGRGSVSFMLFDRETCTTCGGVGRVFD